MLRAAVLFLLVAVAWSLSGVPDTVNLSARSDPDRYADAMGIPDVFDTPRRTASHGIDPSLHRAGIERIESVLYRRGPSDFGDAEAVESAAARLADALLKTDGLRGRQAGLELMTFAGRVGARLDSGYTLPSLVDLRADWEGVRRRVFRRAPWMRTAGTDLDRIQDPPPPAMDPRADEALADALDALHRRLLRAQRDVERLGEPAYDPDRPGRGDRGQIRAWYDWGERHREQLDLAMAPVRTLSPAPDPGREPLHYETSRALEEAHEMLRRVPDGAGMWPTPFRPAWQARLRAASEALARARSTLAQARRERPGHASLVP